MNAEYILEHVVSVFRDRKLQVILIGNAAAAIHGAPVTTDDFDFMFRETSGNLKKLEQAAEDLGGIVTQPKYPVSGLRRFITGDKNHTQIDMMPRLHGIKSFESLRSRAIDVLVGREVVKVASLEDVIESKRAADRPKDRAVLQILEDTLDEIQKEEE